MSELRFGVFLQPRAGDLARLHDNVRAAQETGFDFVALKDHPYEAGLLDTFSLIGVLLGRTDRIRFMPGVANLPLRPPAMLAKAAATLALLSGGRFQLGLGAGYRWDAIEGFGGRRLTPGQAVAATAEAVELIRTMWTAANDVDLVGDHYHLTAAETGPAPGHPVPIWLGANGPRMLDLVGRIADGWISPMAMRYEHKLAAQDRIDAATHAHGRKPGDVRRVLQIVGAVAARPRAEAAPTTGPGVQAVVADVSGWSRILGTFVREQRFDTVTFAPVQETAAQIRRFGEDVIPAARAALY